MDPLDLTVSILTIIFVWSALLSIGTAVVLAVCSLFGRNPNPPGVPNRAVWG